MNGERMVWPWFARSAGVSFALLLVTVYLGNFVDDGWLPFTFVFGVVTVVCGIGWDITASDANTYTVRPRGWRKLRRDAEREAYIRRLEREAGL